MAEIERIVFEPVRDSELWRMRLEGADVEGHLAGHSNLSIEPAEDQESGEALLKVSFGGDDVEGHGPRWGDMPAIPPAGEEAT